MLGLNARRSTAPADPFRADAIPPDAPFTSLSYSVHTSLWWDDGLLTGTHMDWVQLMGFTHVKQVFAWQDIEPNSDEWHFALGDRMLDELERRNIQIVARLSDAPDWAHPSLPPVESGAYIDAPPDDVADYADFCGTIAERYHGRIAAYQIWNEPNLAREWGGRTPEAGAYVELLRVCSEAIRAADPDAVIISAGLAPTGGLTLEGQVVAVPDDVFLQALYDLNFQQYMDVLGAHAPGYEFPEYGPEDAERDGRGRWATFRRIEDLRRIMIENDDAARQIAILEFGYTTDQVNESYQWYAVDVVDQARLLVRAYEYAAQHWRPWVGLMTVIYIPDPEWTAEDEQYWWSITDPTMNTIRPAFAALSQMPKYCGDAVFPARSPEEAALVPADNPCH
ncbi:MAG: cellulase family glycosylhydrolase [bacterium]|nr:cellulase family glycosylhydrolase [bacterium]